METIRTTYINGKLHEECPITLDDDSDLAECIRMLGVYAVDRPLGRFDRTIQFVEVP